MSTENVGWGSSRIRKELARLGYDVAKSTVETYIATRDPDEGSRQRWRTFLPNHMDVATACDLLMREPVAGSRISDTPLRPAATARVFTVPTITFKVLYVFVVLSHDRRRILHINVTRHPTAEWTAQQIVEAFPCGTEPRYLHRDRDAIYGAVFRTTLEALGITEVVSSRRSPWQNPFVERVNGTLRRECVDPFIPLGERHLLRVLRTFVEGLLRLGARARGARRRRPDSATGRTRGEGRCEAHPRRSYHRYGRVAA